MQIISKKKNHTTISLMVQVLEQLYLNHIIGLIKNLNIPNTIFKNCLIRINYPEYRTHIH